MKKQQSPLQFGIGFIVLSVAILFISHIYKIKTSGESSFGTSITLKAKFSNIDGVFSGSDVKISGIKVGKVKSVELNLDDYMAVVSISVDQKTKIPSDSILTVSTSGLLGSKFLEIKPGFSDTFLSNNNSFISTVSSVNLENLISKFATGFGGNGKKEKTE